MGWHPFSAGRGPGFNSPYRIHTSRKPSSYLVPEAGAIVPGVNAPRYATRAPAAAPLAAPSASAGSLNSAPPRNELHDASRPQMHSTITASWSLDDRPRPSSRSEAFRPPPSASSFGLLRHAPTPPWPSASKAASGGSARLDERDSTPVRGSPAQRTALSPPPSEPRDWNRSTTRPTLTPPQHDYGTGRSGARPSSATLSSLPRSPPKKRPSAAVSDRSRSTAQRRVVDMDDDPWYRSFAPHETTSGSSYSPLDVENGRGSPAGPSFNTRRENPSTSTSLFPTDGVKGKPKPRSPPNHDLDTAQSSNAQSPHHDPDTEIEDILRGSGWTPTRPTVPQPPPHRSPATATTRRGGNGLKAAGPQRPTSHSGTADPGSYYAALSLADARHLVSDAGSTFSRAGPGAATSSGGLGPEQARFGTSGPTDASAAAKKNSTRPPFTSNDDARPARSAQQSVQRDAEAHNARFDDSATHFSSTNRRVDQRTLTLRQHDAVGLDRRRVAVGAPGDGDDSYAYVIFRQSSTDRDFYPSEQVEQTLGAEIALQLARGAIDTSLAHYAADAMRAAKATWGATGRESLRTFIAFGSARGAPSKWVNSGVPLPAANTGQAFLKSLPNARRIIVLGVDGLTDNLDALYSEIALQLDADCELMFTRGGMRETPFTMTAAALASALAFQLDLSDDDKEMSDLMVHFIKLLLHGNLRRKRIAEAAADHAGEARRATTKKRRMLPVQRSEPKSWQPVPDATSIQPSSWEWYWRCGRNGCPYVAIRGGVERHREAHPPYIVCYGKCSLGCDTASISIKQRRRHVKDVHPERFLCTLKTCAASLASSAVLKVHVGRHEDGTIRPDGLSANSSWTTVERAMTRPVLPDSDDEA